MNTDISARDQLLDEVVTAYLRAAADGQAPDREKLLAGHPDLAADLVEFFADQDRLQHLAAPLRAVARAAAGEEDLVARTLGDFRILREVGRGGMGVVYEAEQLSLRRRVALKVLPYAGMLDPRALQRFQNEARAAACLHHTNIVPVHFVGSERGVHFYAMQLIDGQTLAALVGQLRQPDAVKEAGPPAGEGTTAYQPAPGGSATPTEPVAAQVTLSTGGPGRGRDYFRKVAALGVQAAEALDHAHQAGIVHRDIKPANLMLDERGNLWVTDFGLAHIQHSEASLTMTGDLVGTLRYMSPEQALAKRVPIDHRTDVYSLGATLYELLTLRPAFDGKDRQELLRQIAFEEPPRLRRLDRSVPAELETIVLKAMEKNPAERYATAQELADDLHRFLEDRPIQARRPTLLQWLRKWRQRHRAVVAVTACLLMLVLAGLAVAVVLIWNQQQETEAARKAEAEQKRQAEKQRDEADRQRQRSEANVDLAFQTLDNLYLKVAEDRLPRDAQPSKVEREFLHKAIQFYEEFIRRNGAEPAVRAAVGRAYLRSGDIYLQLGQEAKGKVAYDRAIALLEALLAESPADASSRRRLAWAYNNLGNLLRDAGKSAEEERAYRRALEIKESLSQDYPDKAEYRTLVAEGHNNLGNLLRETKRLREAAVEYGQAVSLYERLVAEFKRNPKYAQGLAVCLGNLGTVMANTGQPREAEEGCRRALTILEQVAANQRSHPDYRDRQATLFMNLGSLLAGTGRVPAAIEPYQRALALRKKLADDFPNVPSYRSALVMDCLHLGQARQHTNALKEALAAYEEGLEVARALAKEFPTRQPNPSRLLAEVHDRLGFLYPQLGKFGEAVEQYRQLLKLQPNNARACSYLAWLLVNVPDPKVRNPQAAIPLAKTASQLTPKEPTGWLSLGAACYRTEKWAESRAAIEQMLALSPKDPTQALFYLAMAHWQLGEQEEARRRYQQGLTWMQQHGQREHPRRVEAAKLLGIQDQPTRKDKEVSPPKDK